MADFFSLPLKDRAEIFAILADRSGRPGDILEKDVWVVWALRSLFEGPFGEHLCFKGGTSLSKAYGIIERFSEDVDMTYDIRELLAGKLEHTEPDPIPENNSQAMKWRKEIGTLLPEWILGQAMPSIQALVEAEDLPADVVADNDHLVLHYEQASDGRGDYIRPRIQIDFGASSTGEPIELRDVKCDGSSHVDGIEFPSTTVRVMAPARTFWEKATAAHVYCLQNDPIAERFARHWYDLVRLDDAGRAEAALADRALGRHVADWKNYLFREKDRDGKKIDYEKAISGELRLVPEGGPRTSLAQDYEQMVDAGLLEISAPTFDEIMVRCASLQERANADM